MMLLRNWVAEMYKERLIKQSCEPYFNHLLRVAKSAAPYTPLAYEAGLCHDLLEDFPELTPALLHDRLLTCSYGETQAKEIVHAVVELTDVYTADAFPQLKKSERKAEETNRLTGISSLAATVKYADLLDNLNWVTQYRPDKAEKYKVKKLQLLEKLTQGNQHLLHYVVEQFKH